MSYQGSIGVFDSGYGGLTVLQSLVTHLPQYNYLYLGDNARSPYGTRSFETVHQYTWEAVQWFFAQGCPLVILACNTASAKALRTIQQQQLPHVAPNNRVLGVIRPTAEMLGHVTHSQKIGILATPGTVSSDSYVLEMAKFFPQVTVFQEACPMWVPLVENNEHLSPGADYFIRQHTTQLMAKSPDIDTVLLGCTHYPLLINAIQQYLPPNVNIISQGPVVAHSLAQYLERHPEMERRLIKGHQRIFFTTDDPKAFEEKATLFYGQPLTAQHTQLDNEFHD